MPRAALELRPAAKTVNHGCGRRPASIVGLTPHSVAGVLHTWLALHRNPRSSPGLTEWHKNCAPKEI
jgi:hypothetical protein